MPRSERICSQPSAAVQEPQCQRGGKPEVSSKSVRNSNMDETSRLFFLPPGARCLAFQPAIEYRLPPFQAGDNPPSSRGWPGGPPSLSGGSASTDGTNP